MRLLKNRDYLVFASILILQYFISSTLIFVISAIFLGYKLIKNRFQSIRLYVPCVLILLLVSCASIMGIQNLFEGGSGTRDFIRDLFYYLSPVLFILLGQTMVKRRNDHLVGLLGTICISGTILSIYFLINALLNISSFLNGSVQSWRSTVGNGYIESALAIVFSVYLLKKHLFSKPLAIIIVVFNSLEMLLTLSRSNIIVLILFAFIFSLKKIKLNFFLSRGLQYLVIIGLGLLVLSMFPADGIIGQFFSKIMNSTNEISLRSDWASYDSVVNNWRGYETFCAVQQWNEYSLISQLIGKGFGERIYVGEVGSLVYLSISGESSAYIPVLHNGYSTLLIKNGIFGIIIYILFVLWLAYRGFLYANTKPVESKILLSSSITILILTFFICGLFKDNNLLVLMVLIGVSISKKQTYTSDVFCREATSQTFRVSRY